MTITVANSRSKILSEVILGYAQDIHMSGEWLERGDKGREIGDKCSLGLYGGSSQYMKREL